LSPTEPPASRSSRAWTDLGPRVISAVVIIAIIATGLHFGGYVWAVLAAIVFGITYREWEQMVTLKPLAPLGMVLIGLLALAALANPQFGLWGSAIPIAIAVGLTFLGDRSILGWRIGGILFFGLVIIAALQMRGIGSPGIVAGWFLGTVIACNDTGAYFVGRIVGGPKLAPAISPAKTISGSIGGLLAGTIAGTVFWSVFTTSPWWLGLLLAAALGVVGQAGDLTESAIKRIFRIKDSSDFIPGHGGFMDRLDSVTFGLLLLVIIGALHGGFDNSAAGFLSW